MFRQLIGKLDIRAQHVHVALHGQLAFRIADNGQMQIQPLGNDFI